MADVTGVDPKGVSLVYGFREFSFRFSHSRDGGDALLFRARDWAAVAPGLKTIEDAAKQSAAILLLAFEKAELAGHRRGAQGAAHIRSRGRRTDRRRNGRSDCHDCQGSR